MSSARRCEQPVTARPLVVSAFPLTMMVVDSVTGIDIGANRRFQVAAEPPRPGLTGAASSRHGKRPARDRPSMGWRATFRVAEVKRQSSIIAELLTCVSLSTPRAGCSKIADAIIAQAFLRHKAKSSFGAVIGFQKCRRRYSTRTTLRAPDSGQAQAGTD
jgi:hypothetical protein